MTMTIIIVVLLVIVALGTVWFCILPLLWEPDTKPDPKQDECPHGGSELSKEYIAIESGVVRVIRLTDDGEFVHRCELTDAIYEIRNCKRPELIVWYIHGWKHNADENDTDLKNFKSLIKELAEKQSGKDDRRVVGIYVGWDGVVGPAWLWNLSFWNRKRAADRISQSAVLTKIFAATKYARKQESEEITSEDLTIIIGHSFGARILYTATSQVLIDEVQCRHPGKKNACYGVIKGSADLILLLNPALEASVFTAMDSIRRPDEKWWEGIDAGQQPLLLTITTENDWATEKAFPWGQWLAFARKDRQRQTLGNYKEYITHKLLSASEPSDATTAAEPSDATTAAEPSDAPAPRSSFWYDCFKDDDGVQLLRTAKRQHGNPFIVARTTSDIIDGHNGIWREVLRKWMIAFLLRLLQERAKHR
jgi:hypothetical protein